MRRLTTWQRMYWANAVLCVLLVQITIAHRLSFWASLADAVIACYSVFRALGTEGGTDA